MIREIRGTVLSNELLSLVVDVSGWGIQVAVAAPDQYPEGSVVSLKTYLAVKQDGIELYGFPHAADLRFFELMLKAPGVGPKTAIALLRRAPREAIEEAIARKDLTYLTKVAGMGKKSAEKLILEIAEKVSKSTGTSTHEDGEVFDTLVALGYTEREARSALSGIPANIAGQDARLKAALSQGSHT